MLLNAVVVLCHGGKLEKIDLVVYMKQLCCSEFRVSVNMLSVQACQISPFVTFCIDHHKRLVLKAAASRLVAVAFKRHWRRYTFSVTQWCC